VGARGWVTAVAMLFVVLPGWATSAQPLSPTVKRAPDRLAPEASRAIDAAAAKALASGSPGMVVAASDARGVLFSRSYGQADLEHGAPIRPDTVFQIASVTKQFTAAAVLLMVEDGRLSLDDRLSQHVPEFPGGDRVTIRHLLTLTSGIPDYAEDPAGDRIKSVPKTPSEMVAWIAQLRPAFNFEPGAGWGYSNSNYVLLGLVVERVSGESLASVFRKRLFDPARMTRTAFDDPTEVVLHRAQGYRKAKAAASGFANAAWISPTIPGAAGGLRSTAGDLLLWTRALFDGRILKPESLALMTTPGRLTDGRTNKNGMPVPMQKGWNSDYGLGLFLGSPDGRRRFWHAGDVDGFASWLAYYPDRGLAVVILQNSQSADRFESDIERALLGPSSRAAN
jgi:CubicO group peptidase (beta-lactamase class C family)